MDSISKAGNLFGSSEPTAAASFEGTPTVVRIGEDSLASIAQRLGTPADALANANPQLADQAAILPGQEINVSPAKEQSSPDSGTGLSDKASPDATAVDPAARKHDFTLEGQFRKTMLEVSLNNMSGIGEGLPGGSTGLTVGDGSGLQGGGESPLGWNAGVGDSVLDMLKGLADNPSMGLESGGTHSGGSGVANGVIDLVRGGIQFGDYKVTVGWQGSTSNMYDGTKEGNWAKEQSYREKLIDMSGRYDSDGIPKDAGGGKKADDSCPAGSDAVCQQPGLGDSAPTIGGDKSGSGGSEGDAQGDIKLTTGTDLDFNQGFGTTWYETDGSTTTENPYQSDGAGGPGGAGGTGGSQSSSETGGSEGTGGSGGSEDAGGTGAAGGTDDPHESGHASNDEDGTVDEGGDGVDGSDHTDAVEEGSSEDGENAGGADSGKKPLILDGHMSFFDAISQTEKTPEGKEPKGDPMNLVGGAGGELQGGSAPTGDELGIGGKSGGQGRSPGEALIGPGRLDGAGRSGDDVEDFVIYNPDLIDPV